VGGIVYDTLKIPFTKLTRRLLDRAMHTRFLYRGIHETDFSQRIFVQDMFVPREGMQPFFDYVNRKLGIWPLWLLPMKTQDERLDIFGLPHAKTSYMINFGIWGKTNAATFQEFKSLNRDVEDELAKYKGRKTLYAHSYYSKAVFWKIYSQTQYSRLRKKYYAEDAFDDIYQKVTVNQAYDAPLSRAFIQHFIKKMRRRVCPIPKK
jgi:delta24-sterol reductase